MGRRVPLRTLILSLAPFGVALVGAALLEVVAPEFAAARAASVPVFLVLAGVTVGLGFVVPRLAERFDSLRHAHVAATVAAMAITGSTIVLSASVMILQPNELVVILALFAVGSALALLLEYRVAGSLARDVRRLGDAAQRIGAGDLRARAGIERSDEVGRVAAAMDSLAASLQEARDERDRERQVRQRFLAGVGHDLRTPLAALRAASDALEDGMASDPSRYFAAMRHDIRAMAGLVDDLFLLARIETGSFDVPRVPIDLRELVDEAVEALTPLALEREVAVRVEGDPPVIVTVAPAEIARSVRNLLDNAIRLSRGGTEVLVEVGRRDGEAQVCVVDQGEGFPPESQDRIFDGYAGSADVDGGRGRPGLGLTIAKGLVEMHGGRIWIERRRGGRICFSLPIHRVH